MPKNQTLSIPKKHNRATQNRLSLDAFVNAKNERFVNTKKIERKRKIKKIVGQFHQIKQQSEKQSANQPATEKSFYDMVFSGELDLDAYNNHGVIQKSNHEELTDIDLNNNISSYIREKTESEQYHDKNTNKRTNNYKNKQSMKDNIEEIEESEQNSTKKQSQKTGKSNKGKKKDFAYKIPEFQEARQRFEKKQAEIETARQAKAERLQKLEQDKKSRSEMKKKLGMKTSKGQPIMKNQVDLLLSKLQKKS